VTRLLWWDRTARSAAEQMAIDAVLPEVAAARGLELLRLYQWRRDTLSLGAHEAALRTWRRDRLAADDVEVVRRPTGGRGVWHATSDLTYAWGGPVEGVAAARQQYRELHRMLARALATNGLAAGVATAPTGRADLTPGACFDLAIGGEVLVAGRKAIGSAQRIQARTALQHGAIALRDHRDHMGPYLVRSPAAARSSQEEWPDAATLAATILAQARAEGAAMAPIELIAAVEQASLTQVATFGDPTWTWRR
jgi:lipoate-protein ligase A